MTPLYRMEIYTGWMGCATGPSREEARVLYSRRYDLRSSCVGATARWPRGLEDVARLDKTPGWMLGAI